MATLAWRDAKPYEHLSQEAGNSQGLKRVHNVIEIQYRCTKPLGSKIILKWILEKCIVKLWNGSYLPITNFLNISDEPTTSFSAVKSSFTGRSFIFSFLRICKQTRQLTHTVLLYKRNCRAVGWTALEVQWWARCEVELLIFQQLTWSQSSVGQTLQWAATPRWPSRARLALTIQSLTKLHDPQSTSSLAAGSR
jgi:hypothetical protein